MTGINWASKRGGLGGHVPVSINKNSELRCPRCGGSDLHHGPASVFQRAKEDGPTTETHFVAYALGPFASYVAPEDTIMPNPSPRRGALSIGFWCEFCDGQGLCAMRLEIVQHKGRSLIGWNMQPTDAHEDTTS
jgi:hypothetical protein